MMWLIVLLSAVLLRLRVNNLRAFSTADETTYLQHVQDRRPLREALVGHVFNTPPPYRVGWVWLCRLCRVETHRGLANISTAFSTGTVIAACLAVKPEHRTLTALLVGATPIGLAMGRRALQDAAIAFMVLLCFAFVDRLWLWPAIAAALVLVSFKEVAFIFAAPALAALWILRGGSLIGLGLILTLPPALLGGLLLAMVRDFGLLWRTAIATTKQDNCPYACAFGRGPIHTYLVQWFMLSPIVAVAVAIMRPGGALMVAVVIYAGLLCLTAFKNYRMFVGADVLLRILAAGALAAVPYGLAVAAVSAAAELWIFRRVFMQCRVYDPVLFNVAQALGMVPSRVIVEA